MSQRRHFVFRSDKTTSVPADDLDKKHGCANCHIRHTNHLIIVLRTKCVGPSSNAASCSQTPVEEEREEEDRQCQGYCDPKRFWQRRSLRRSWRTPRLSQLALHAAGGAANFLLAIACSFLTFQCLPVTSTLTARRWRKIHGAMPFGMTIVAVKIFLTAHMSMFFGRVSLPAVVQSRKR